MCKQLKLFILINSMFCYTSKIEAQSIGSFKNLVDSIDILEKLQDYSALITLGELAIDKKIDYYNLRMRLGNAYFKQEKTQNAYYHYYKAFKLNPSSLEAIQQMHTCALLAGQSTLTDYFNSSLGIANHRLQKIYLETGTKLSNRTDSIQHIYYGHLGLLLNANKYLESYLGYFYCTQNSSLYNVLQHQYLGIATVTINPTVQVKIGCSYLHTLVNDLTLLQQQTISNYTEAIAIQKQYRNINLGVNTAIGRLNKKQQWQIGATFNYAPKGNNKLGFQFNPIIQNQDNQYHIIYNPGISVKLYRNCWLIGSYAYVNTTNYIEQEGFIVNNNYDLTKDKIALMLNYKTANNKDFYLCYQFENKSRKYIEPVYYSEINQAYTFQNIIIGYTLKN